MLLAYFARTSLALVRQQALVQKCSEIGHRPEHLRNMAGTCDRGFRSCVRDGPALIHLGGIVALSSGCVADE